MCTWCYLIIFGCIDFIYFSLGSIPSSWGDQPISNMIVLNLHLNKLSGKLLVINSLLFCTIFLTIYRIPIGPIPSSLGVFSNLVSMAIHENSLTGVLFDMYCVSLCCSNIYLLLHRLNPGFLEQFVFHVCSRI